MSGSEGQACKGRQMAAAEVSAKGIILSAAPQGEYGRRLVVLTDLFGKITVFASGAAKVSSHLIGLVRPMTCAVFRLQRGRSAWNLHGAELIEAFEGLQRSYEATLYGLYVLELAAYEAQEGMTEGEAKDMLNLMYVTLMALQQAAATEAAETTEVAYALIRRMYELRMLKLAGEYTALPLYDAGEETAALWQRVLALPLTKLYQQGALNPQGELTSETQQSFCREVARLFARQIPVSFRTEKLLGEL